MQQRCPNCGSPVVPGQRFCGGCGAQLSLACPQCRITVSPGTRFCPNCGATLGGGGPPQQPGWGPQPGGMPPQQPGWGQQPGWAPPAPKSQPASSNRPFLVVLLFVLLIGLGFLTYQYTPIGKTLLNFFNSSTGGTGSTTDTTKPVITNAKATVGVGAVVITWKTDELSSSQVEYGKTTTYDSVYPAQPDTDPTTGQYAGVVEHSVTISTASLEQEATYHYRVKSKDKANNESVSSDKTFTTIATPE